NARENGRIRPSTKRSGLPEVLVAVSTSRLSCKRAGKTRALCWVGIHLENLGSIATPVTAPKGGQFVLHAKALHGNPYDGHTLGPVIADLEKLTGVTVRRIHEPVIGHLKEDHRMGRNYLTGPDGDRINAVLAAAGYNFSLAGSRSSYASSRRSFGTPSWPSRFT